ncbi:MAG: CoA transferase [Alphaproteobacteria bacterium]|nr:CoA transferase [Alphaproteobacteria bacterium]
MNASPGALAGIKVVDLTRILSGPYGSQILADHGATVIKVEPPAGDETRDWGPPFRDGTASYFVGVNRNKRSIALDLTKPEGREVLFRLLEDADVLFENFKTGQLQKWGLDYETVLKPRFPRLIYAQISGFGPDGPLGGLPGYDAAVQASSGLMSINGSPESGPVRLGTPIVDLGTGLNAVLGICMAIIERQRSGLGQHVECSLYDVGISLLHPQAANWFMSGEPPKLLGNSHPNICPYDQYRTRTRPIFLAVGNDTQFRRLCDCLGVPDLPGEARFRTNRDRVANRDALNAVLQDLLLRHDGPALASRLLDLGVPVGPVQSIPEVMEDPHTRHREMVVAIDDYRGTGIPLKLSRTPGAARSKPPAFGADGRAILREHGLSDAEIDALTAAGIVCAERRTGR